MFETCEFHCWKESASAPLPSASRGLIVFDSQSITAAYCLSAAFRLACNAAALALSIVKSPRRAGGFQKSNDVAKPSWKTVFIACLPGRKIAFHSAQGEGGCALTHELYGLGP